MVYHTRVTGELDQSWTIWLGAVQITLDRDEPGGIITTLMVDVVDQSALFGILDRIRDLNLELLSVGQDK